MPFITIDMLEGRTPDQKREIAKRITETIAEFAEVKPDVVWIKFNEMKKEDFSTSGILHIDR